MSSKSFTFPNPLTPKREKDTQEFGKQVFNAIEYVMSNRQGERVMQINTCRQYASGRQPVQPYLDQIKSNGKLEWVNISYKPVKYIDNIENIVVDGYMMQQEFPRATATSQHILDRKDKKKSDLKFRLQYGQLISDLSQQVGFSLEDPNSETPETDEEIDIYMELNDREREEVLMQEGIEFILRENDFDSKKRIFLQDQFETAFGGYYVYTDENGRIRIKNIRPEDAIYDTSFSDIITKDVTYAGHRERAYICDVRNKFNLTPEEEEILYTCAVQAVGLYGNTSRALSQWQEDWRTARKRPYDNFIVELYHIWYRTSNELGYVEGTDSKGRTVFDTTWDYDKLRGRYKNHPTKRVGGKTIGTSYEGWFVKGGELCLEWCQSKKILKPKMDLDDVLCPYVYLMPKNQGTMNTESPVEKMIPYIDNMEVSMLRIKQAIANATPSGYAIDLDALTAVNIGTGKDLEPIEISDIYKETGTLYYRSTGGDGESGKPNLPVTQLPYDVETSIRGYINWYNTNLEYIRQAIGVNEFRDGTANNARTGFRFAQSQMESSNTATYYLYDAFIRASKEAIRISGILLWYELKYGKKNEGYLKYLGEENVKFLDHAKEITDSSYDFDFQLEMSGTQKQHLEENIQQALSTQAIDLSDAIMIRRVHSLPLAERMLIYYQVKRRKLRMEESKATVQAQSEAQTQQAIATKEAEAQLVNLKTEAELKVTQEKSKATINEEMIKMATGILSKQGLGQQITPFEQQILNKVAEVIGITVENTVFDQTVELEQKQQQLQQMEEEQQLAMMEEADSD